MIYWKLFQISHPRSVFEGDQFWAGSVVEKSLLIRWFGEVVYIYVFELICLILTNREEKYLKLTPVKVRSQLWDFSMRWLFKKAGVSQACWVICRVRKSKAWFSFAVLGTCSMIRNLRNWVQFVYTLIRWCNTKYSFAMLRNSNPIESLHCRNEQR